MSYQNPAMGELIDVADSRRTRKSTRRKSRALSQSRSTTCRVFGLLALAPGSDAKERYRLSLLFPPPARLPAAGRDLKLISGRSRGRHASEPAERTRHTRRC